MADPRRNELRIQQKRAVLVAVIGRDGDIEKDHVLDELTGLAKTAGVDAVGTLIQVRQHRHPATCLGSGKLNELKHLIEQTDAELVLFDNNLTPAQGRNLEAETDTIIVDRSEIILDIFATTARTYEARLQVELAQLLYMRPRLKRLWTHLERIEGGVGTGRGPGEKQLETDRRLLDQRVAELKKKLQVVEKRRRRTVAGRMDRLCVSLVGYTNAGKSTLMNALCGADVLVADRLFATLDTRTRRWALPNWGDVLLSDTVGFVRNLPHHLVASFHSTLEEARHADLLLHVVDASHREAEVQVATVNDVLERVGVDCSNVLLVLNKIDAVQNRTDLDVLRHQYDESVTVSAVTGEGLQQLTAAVAERLSDGFVQAEIETGVGNGRLFAYLAEHADVTAREYTDSRVRLSCRIPQRFLNGVGGEATEVRVMDAGCVDTSGNCPSSQEMLPSHDREPRADS